MSINTFPLLAAVAAEESPRDSEEQVDDGLKKFGYLAGLARNSVVDKQQTGIELEVVDLHGAIGRLLGTDRAFLFAASFGYGTSMSLKPDECKEVLLHYEARVEKFRAGQRAKKDRFEDNHLIGVQPDTLIHVHPTAGLWGTLGGAPGGAGGNTRGTPGEARGMARTQALRYSRMRPSRDTRGISGGWA